MTDCKPQTKVTAVSRTLIVLGVKRLSIDDTNFSLASYSLGESSCQLQGLLLPWNIPLQWDGLVGSGPCKQILKFSEILQVNCLKKSVIY